MTLRILMTADAVGGVWTYATDLARALCDGADEVAVTLADLGPEPDPSQRAAIADLPRLDLVATGLPLDWLAEDEDSLRAAGAALADLAARCGADIVHLNHPAYAAMASFPAPVVAVSHSCLASWWAAMRSGPLPGDFAWRIDLMGRGLAAADAIVVPSHAHAAVTRAQYTAAPPPMVIENGRAPPPRLRVRGDTIPVLTAGRLWDDAKNIAVLDRAAGRLETPVAAAGPAAGPNGARIVPQHLRMLGSRDAEALRRDLVRTEIFVAIPRYEPFGLAILEAAQMGCALVLSDIPTLRELWHGAADFVPPEDDIAVAAALEHMLVDRPHREARARAARRRSRRYTATAMAAGYHDLYRRLAPGFGRGRTGGAAETRPDRARGAAETRKGRAA